MENTREKNKRADGRKKTYFDRENKKKAARTEKTKSVAPEKGKQKKSSSSSKCPYQKKCGGCTYLNLSYEEQLAKKEQFLKKTLNGIVPVKGMVGMENPYHYRNKVNSAFARKKDGTIISGIYEKGTHKVVPVDECLLEDQRADAIIRDIRSLLKSFKIMIYNEDSGYGLLRHVMVRTGFASGEIMVVLVCVSPVFPSKNNFVKALRKLHPEITTIVLNVNDRTDSMVLGKRDIVLFGRGYIEDELCGCTFRISPQSFYQVNPAQTEKLYGLALEYAGLTGNETVWDLYCGIGTISLFLAQKAKKVYGVEIVPEAIADAKNNAKINEIENAEFFVGKSEEILPAYYEQYAKDHPGEHAHADVIVVDPPRKGCEENLLHTMASMQPDRIVYVSCDSATLARDVKVLGELGYEVKKVRGVDQFPMTCHVETVVLLSQQKPDDTIEIDLDLDELDATSAELKATYQEIKDYVLKESGLKVSSLYISQVKRKCGIEVGENYNLPKTENPKVLQCPKEKEDAIKAALKYFAMI